MNTFNLMNIFNGFIRNYENFNLNINEEKEEFTKQENKFFIMIGQLLGYEVLSKTGNNLFNKKIVWIDKENEDKSVVIIVREEDLTEDLKNIQNLISYSKNNYYNNIINIVETSSENRIEYLNNIILTSNLCIKKEILVIYIVKDILNSRNYITANLYVANNLISTKKAIIYAKNNTFIGEFIVH